MVYYEKEERYSKVNSSITFDLLILFSNILGDKKPVATQEPHVNPHKVKTEPSKEEEVIKTVEPVKDVSKENSSIPSESTSKKDLKEEIKDSGVPVEDEDELEGMEVFAAALEQVRKLN